MQVGLSPLRDPSGLDIQVFREHTEDVYCDIEWKKGSPEAKQLINFLNQDLAKKLEKTVRPDSGIGIKPISATATKRLIRLTLDYAVRHKRRAVHFVHSGSTMKHTEGFFRDWGYEIARKEFADYTVTEQQVRDEHDGEAPRGRVLIGDRSATDLFQELLIHPENFDLLATTNLNGAFVQSLALGAAGERGIAPHGYVGAKAAVFQATQADRARGVEPGEENPSSVLLAGVMLFDHLGWKDSAELLTNALIKTIEDGMVTADFPQQGEGVEVLGTAEFCEAVVENFEEVRKSRVRQAMKRTATAGR